MYDLSKTKHSITAKVESLIGRMEKMDDLEIRREFADILSAEDTHVSDTTKKKWFGAMATQKSKNSLMRMISNLYLGGCNLKVA
jgi:hypothetical protein